MSKSHFNQKYLILMSTYGWFNNRLLKPFHSTNFSRIKIQGVTFLICIGVKISVKPITYLLFKFKN